MNAISHIQRIRTPLGPRFADLWLFQGGDEFALYDTGIQGTLVKDVLPHLGSMGATRAQIRSVIVSHLDVDHCGDVGSVAATLPNARVVAHVGDAAAIADWDTFSAVRGREFAHGWGLDESRENMEWMREVFSPGPVNEILTEETTLELGDGRLLEIWHVPGHTRGHLAVFDPEHNTLAIADAILGSAVPLADGSPSFPPTYRYVQAYLETIARVRAAQPEVLLTAHYGDYVGDDIPAFLDESETFVSQLHDAVMGEISTEPKTLSVIVDAVNPRVARWPIDGTRTAMAFPVAGHLELALASGSVQRVDLDGVWGWTL